VKIFSPVADIYSSCTISTAVPPPLDNADGFTAGVHLPATERRSIIFLTQLKLHTRTAYCSY